MATNYEEIIKIILPPRAKESSKETKPGRFEGRNRGRRGHEGVDFSYSNGQGGVIKKGPPVHSPVDGTVVRAGGGSQNAVTIKDANRTLDGKPIYHRFIHNQKVLVDKNQTVKAGDKIAIVGNTGTKDYHVHYEVLVGGDYKAGNPIDPMKFWNDEKQIYIPNISIEALKDTHEEDQRHYDVEAGAPPIPKTPERAIVLHPPKTPSGQIDDYSPRQAAVAAYSEAQEAVWTNRVPQHEPWPRTLMIHSEGVNAPSDEYLYNNRHMPQYSPDHKDVGRVEGEDTIERGPFWRR